MRRTVYVLYTAISAQAVGEVLSRSIDEEQWTLFSLSGYRGSRPILGNVRGNTFRLRKRRYSRNDFADNFYGRFEPEQGGTRIEGYFDMPAWAKYFMRIWLAGVALFGTLVFVATSLDLATHSDYTTGDKWIGLLVPPALILYGTVFSKLVRMFGKRDRHFILQHIQNSLAARLEADADVAP